MSLSYRVGALIALAWASTAWGQIIYAPPAPPVVYNPYNPILDYQSIERLRTLGFGKYFEKEVPGTTYPAQEAVSIDPNTGQPLFFRKRDLLQQMQQQNGNGDPKPAASDSRVVPANRLPAADDAPKGQIIIKPYVPRARMVAQR